MIEVVPFADRHLTDNYVSWLNNPDVTKHMRHSNAVHTLKSCEDYWRGTTIHGDLMFAIEVNGAHIGNVTVVCDNLNKRCDVSILIGDSKSHGSGIGTSVFRTVISKMMGMGYHKVTAGTSVDNIGMIKVMQKADMFEDGIRKSHDLRNGKRVDVVHYAAVEP